MQRRASLKRRTNQFTRSSEARVS
uniref:Uncharacterized protein n=1 Tax=Arundo donax TaxID=35708 RepID=A0A0A9A3G1_ARUDO